MKTKPMKTNIQKSLSTFAALLGSAVLAHAQAGSTTFGAGNTMFGTYSLASGGFNTIYGGYGNHALGWSATIGTGSFNLVTGLQNVTSGDFNFVTGLGNQPSGAFGIYGGQNNVGGGNQNLVFGSFLSSGSVGGSVLLADGNPFSLRTAAARRTNTTANSFLGLFNGGYALRLNDGQGANSSAGVFIVPSAAHTASVSNPARVGINTQSAEASLHVLSNGAGAIGVAVFDRLVDDGVLLRFRRDGTFVGSIDVAAGVVSYNAFTGSHYAMTNEAIERGMLVTLTGKNGRLEDRPESEILYGVTKSSRANDPAILGAYLARQNNGATSLAASANPHLVEAVGNGEMWVIDTGKDLAAGEYLLSSAVEGHAMTDPETFEVSNIIARVAEPIVWKSVTTTVKGPDGRECKRALVSVFFQNFVIDRKHDRAKDAEIAKLAAKLAALEARDAAREARLARLEAAGQDRPARAVNAALELTTTSK